MGQSNRPCEIDMSFRLEPHRTPEQREFSRLRRFYGPPPPTIDVVLSDGTIEKVEVIGPGNIIAECAQPKMRRFTTTRPLVDSFIVDEIRNRQLLQQQMYDSQFEDKTVRDFWDSILSRSPSGRVKSKPVFMDIETGYKDNGVFIAVDDGLIGADYSVIEKRVMGQYGIEVVDLVKIRTKQEWPLGGCVTGRASSHTAFEDFPKQLPRPKED